MNYYLLLLEDKFPIPMGFGVCLPEVCAIDDLQTFKPFFV